jgi:hypothetical protein
LCYNPRVIQKPTPRTPPSRLQILWNQLLDDLFVVDLRVLVANIFTGSKPNVR